MWAGMVQTRTPRHRGLMPGLCSEEQAAVWEPPSALRAYVRGRLKFAKVMSKRSSKPQRPVERKFWLAGAETSADLWGRWRLDGRAVPQSGVMSHRRQGRLETIMAAPWAGTDRTFRSTACREAIRGFRIRCLSCEQTGPRGASKTCGRARRLARLHQPHFLPSFSRPAFWRSSGVMQGVKLTFASKYRNQGSANFGISDVFFRSTMR